MKRIKKLEENEVIFSGACDFGDIYLMIPVVFYKFYSQNFQF